MYAIALLLCAGLFVLTRDYNRAWCNEIALWERGVQSDPKSAHSFGQLGEAYRKAGRLEDAKRALSRAVELNPAATWPRVGLGIIATEEGRFETAEQLLRQIVEGRPENDVALERLADCYQRQGRTDEAVAVFQLGIQRMPFKRPVYIMNIAILKAMANRKQEALVDMETIRPDLERSRDPALLMGWLNLGDLYRETGRGAEAIDCYQRFLDATADMDSAATRGIRERCAHAVAELKQR